MFIPLIIKAETCDTDKITIESITLKDKTGNADELSEAKTEGKKVILDLSMSKVGDAVEYTVVVKNDSNMDFDLKDMIKKDNFEYVNYQILTEDTSKVLEANSSKTVTLKRLP